MTELNFRLSIVAQERWILLLSKVSGVSIETIERLQAPLRAGEITSEDLQHLSAIATALEIEIIDLIEPESGSLAGLIPTARDIFIDRILTIVQQRGLEIETTEVVFPGLGGMPGEMMGGGGLAGGGGFAGGLPTAIMLRSVRPQCIAYATCVATRKKDDPPCSKPDGC